MNAEPVIHQLQMSEDAGVQQNIYAEQIIPQHIYTEDLQKRTQIYRAENILQNAQAYGEAVLQSEATTTQKHKSSHICVVCNIAFTSKRELKAHYVEHHGEKAHICYVCHKRFTQKTSLQTHYLIHTGDKPHVCDVCNRGFTDKSTLRKHILIHTGEKPHECVVCNRGFAQKISLRKHYLTHTGEKYHICEICNKRFAQKSTLRTHYLVHSGERRSRKREAKTSEENEKPIMPETELPPIVRSDAEHEPEMTDQKQ